MRRTSNYAIALAIALGACGDTTGPNTNPPPPPPPVKCSDGTPAPGGNVQLCPSQGEIKDVSISASFVYPSGGYPMVRWTVRASGQSTTGQVKLTKARIGATDATVDGETATALVPGGSHRACVTLSVATTQPPLQKEFCGTFSASWIDFRVTSGVATSAGTIPAAGQRMSINQGAPMAFDADGTLEVPFPGDYSPTMARIDLLGSSEYFPNQFDDVPLSSVLSARTLRRNFTIPDGVFAGQSVALDLNEATSLVNGGPYSVNNSSLWYAVPEPEGTVALAVARWGAVSIPFAFEDEFTLEEKAEMRACMGVLATHIPQPTLPRLDEVPQENARLMILKDLSISANGQASIVTTTAGEITQARIWLRQVRCRTLMHEIVHTLGFGHSRFPGVMGINAGQTALDLPTALEVAHIMASRLVSEVDMVSVLNAITDKKWRPFYSPPSGNSAMAALLSTRETVREMCK